MAVTVVGGVEYVPIEPFLSWLKGTKALMRERQYMKDWEIAEALGLGDDRTFRHLFHPERLTVSVDVVDRAYCAAGLPYLLREHYPELYVDPVAA